MAGNTPDHIQCRFCRWKTPKWRKTADGKQKGPSTAFARLKDHTQDEHPETYDRIYAMLAECTRGRD